MVSLWMSVTVLSTPNTGEVNADGKVDNYFT